MGYDICLHFLFHIYHLPTIARHFLSNLYPMHRSGKLPRLKVMTDNGQATECDEPEEAAGPALFVYY